MTLVDVPAFGAWSLLSLTTTAHGAPIYPDELEVRYVYDNTVPNGRYIVPGDLAILNAIWTAETQAARHDRYRELVTAALPPGHRQPLSHQARWLFRTLHAAELAGLDPAEIIASAIASRDLAGSLDIAAVLDARIRPRVDPLLPRPQGPWAERVPHQSDPEHRAYLAEIAARWTTASSG